MAAGTRAQPPSEWMRIDEAKKRSAAVMNQTAERYKGLIETKEKEWNDEKAKLQEDMGKLPHSFASRRHTDRAMEVLSSVSHGDGE